MREHLVPPLAAVLAAVLVAGWGTAAEVEDPGLRLFLATGCGACHRIAGTPAAGEIGPDLTDLAGRATIGANLLEMRRENLTAWITRTQELKPGARMPAFGMLPAAETALIVDYLMTLR